MHLPDHLGSIGLLADTSGNLQNRYDYTSYGDLEGGLSNPSGLNPYTYTGREDDNTGLYYYRARYYNPSLEIFISDDPLGDAQRYVGGNPLSFVDPLGLDAIHADFIGFPIAVGRVNGQNIVLPVWHSAVIAIDPKTGYSKLLQFGRYDGECGKVLIEDIDQAYKVLI